MCLFVFNLFGIDLQNQRKFCQIKFFSFCCFCCFYSNSLSLEKKCCVSGLHLQTKQSFPCQSNNIPFFSSLMEITCKNLRHGLLHHLSCTLLKIKLKDSTPKIWPKVLPVIIGGPRNQSEQWKQVFTITFKLISKLFTRQLVWKETTRISCKGKSWLPAFIITGKIWLFSKKEKKPEKKSKIFCFSAGNL